jgi:hypothetical protein
MRELSVSEICLVSGGADECAAGGGNTYGGINEPSTLGKDIIEIYEGLVEATSHIIERVASAL